MLEPDGTDDESIPDEQLFAAEHSPHLDDDGPPSGTEGAALTIRENRLKQWFLIEGNRFTVSGVVLLGVFIALLVASLVWPIEMTQLVAEGNATQRLFNALLGGTILLVSIVVSINSIVLSQDLTSIGTERERVQSAVDFRNTVEELAGIETSPMDPAAFLQAMVELLVDAADDVEAAVEDEDEEFRQWTADFLHGVRLHVAQVSDRVRGDYDQIDVLLAGLSYDYASDAETARWLAASREDELSEAQRESFERIAETLTQFSIAHEYFKSLIYMRGFAKLSKTMLYVSLPVIVFTSYVMLALSSGAYPSFAVGRLSSLTLLIVFAYSVALTPYVVLATFVLRSASIAVRSLATGPFVMDPK